MFLFLFSGDEPYGFFNFLIRVIGSLEIPIRMNLNLVILKIIHYYQGCVYWTSTIYDLHLLKDRHMRTEGGYFVKDFTKRLHFCQY